MWGLVQVELRLWLARGSPLQLYFAYIGMSTRTFLGSFGDIKRPNNRQNVT